VHDVDGVGPALYDGDRPVVVDAGFEVAPGDASDIEVANAHHWGSYLLVFCDSRCESRADGTVFQQENSACTSLQLGFSPSDKGIPCSFPIEILF
jgi:hypothetical protein